MNKKLKNYKVGLDSETFAISLVSDPAVEETLVYMSQDKEDIKLSSDEKHMVFSAVLVPDKPIYRNDGEREFYLTFTKESIEKMSQDYLKEFRQKNVTLQHEEEAPEVCLVESWIKTDLALDKSVALGLNPALPVGTWIGGFKVNNIDTWERVKSGELKGFSVESMIALEDFSKIDEEEISMGMMSKIKEYVTNLFNSLKEEDFEAEPAPAEPTPAEPVEPEPVEPQPVEPQPTEKAYEQEVAELNATLEALKTEIAALKSLNEGMQNKIDDLSKQPSAKPINPLGGNGSQGDAYSQWRERMSQLL